VQNAQLFQTNVGTPLTKTQNNFKSMKVNASS